MSLDDIDVIDAIGIDKKTGDSILSILDYWDWSNEHEHLLALQEKINAYLEFIETGQLFEDYPLTSGKRLVIDVATRHDIPESAVNLIQSACKVSAILNVGISQRTIG